ncbi:uncharacterized protein N7482_003930 [Penicillium canariense]|uniref:Uncharacterized protein n=1 Tax=Penicillium canariense TaxID=189055 RepID=A0A9W9I5N1_9EURO|nr:uncharacterized protein N7482_003930 [Penicillium canariense]KAJ5168336.1 hypothetical protein N7482_003930 [Penicillium canariense]
MANMANTANTTNTYRHGPGHGRRSRNLRIEGVWQYDITASQTERQPCLARDTLNADYRAREEGTGPRKAALRQGPP